MRLKVISYNNNQDFHVCQNENGSKINVDICVDGGLGEICHNREELIGKIIECDYLRTYMEIAHNVRISQ